MIQASQNGRGDGGYLPLSLICARVDCPSQCARLLIDLQKYAQFMIYITIFASTVSQEAVKINNVAHREPLRSRSDINHAT